MPELPEVETVVRTLETKIKDLMITDIEFIYPRIIDGDINDFKRSLVGQHFREFDRRGKYLIFKMDDITFISHLRMEGKYYILPPEIKRDKHTHIVFKLSDGNELRYHDVRKFGRMELMPLQKEYKVFKDLGPEPFSDDFNLEYCKNYLSKKNKPIKEVLLDQSFVAGVGNIYADEICFAIRVNPLKIANTLSDKEITSLIEETRKILSKAIEAGGTTIRSYTSSLGVTGLFQLSLNVHTMEECPICKSPIKKIRVGGRGTYYCEACQK
ncbi:MAG: DNA-formamidopyrimidine glycosylase [Erysipelotrichaceae bacterium]|nr:DNA-formamidopyrimidine glycosylase [Erysipelotrichaceae bacterium]